MQADLPEPGRQHDHDQTTLASTKVNAVRSQLSISSFLVPDDRIVGELLNEYLRQVSLGQAPQADGRYFAALAPLTYEMTFRAPGVKSSRSIHMRFACRDATAAKSTRMP